MESLQHTRLELDRFPAQVRKHVDPQSPPPLRMMAAKAMAPMQPLELAMALYQLTFDPDPKIREAATQSITELPDDILGAVVGAELDARVLDLFARRLVDDERRLEPLVLNSAVADATIAWLAQHVGERTSEIIAGIHTRLLRAPAIIEALYLNPHARMSTVDKVIDLARRNDISLAGLPGLQQALESGGLYDDGQEKNEVSDRAFAEVLKSSQAQAEDGNGDDERIDKLLAGEEEPATEEEKKRQSRWQIIQTMNAAQKIRLAMVGGAEDRNILLRDARRVVHMAAIQSPKVTMGEVSKLAGNRSLPAPVVEYIARNRDWTRYYPVLLGLVNNPKTPMGESVGFLKLIRANDLRALQRNKNIPAQLARQARAFYQKKSGGGSRG